MAGSAFVGQPPMSQDDYDIVHGMLRVMGLPDGTLDPANGLPLPLKRPANDHYPISYPNQGPGITAAICVAIVSVFLVTGARLGLRFFKKDLHWGLEDIFIIPAAFGVIAWLSIVIAMVRYGGAGKHMYDATYREVYWFVRLASVAQFIFWLTVGLIKISITLFNRRLTGLTSRRWKVAHNVFLFLLTIYMITAIFLNIFTCTPAFSQFSINTYGSLPKAPKCMNRNAVGIALSVIHIVFDFVLLSVPLIVLWKIKMSATKKLRIGFLFSVGAISCVGSVMRQLAQYHTSADLTWSLDVINWTTVDIVFAITAASLPILNALIPQRWRFSTHSLPQMSSWAGNSRSRKDRQTRQRLECGDDIRAPMPLGKISQFRFHDERFLNQDSQETIYAKDNNTRLDGTEVLPKLEFHRGASLEGDRDIEKYTHPSSDSFTSRWNSQAELQPPRGVHRPNWSLDTTSTKGDFL